MKEKTKKEKNKKKKREMERKGKEDQVILFMLYQGD